MKSPLSISSIYLCSFISFIGMYSLIFIFIGMDLGLESRYYTVPIRVVVTLLMLRIVLTWKYSEFENKMSINYFLLFYVFYVLKIFYEMLIDNKELYISGYEYFGYSVVYDLIPFLFFIQRKPENMYDQAFRGIFLSGVLISILGIFLIGFQIWSSGYFDRDEFEMNPLLISYSGSLIVGLCTSKLIMGKRMSIKYIFGCLIGFVPLLMGGSRGPLIALVVSLLFIIIVQGKAMQLIKYLFFGVFIMIFLYYLSTLINSITFVRFFNVVEEYQTNDDSFTRLVIWRDAIDQFLSSPIVGDSIQTNSILYPYPHNQFIEVLMSTGLIGFIPYFLLMLNGILKSIKIVRYRKTHSWISVLFIQSILSGMLSGNIYSDIWYFSSLGLVLSFPLENVESDYLQQKISKPLSNYLVYDKF